MGPDHRKVGATHPDLRLQDLARAGCRRNAAGALCKPEVVAR